MRAFGWSVLALVFVTEVLCAVAAGIAASARIGAAGAILGPVLVIGVWWLFASPRAPYGNPRVRPWVKVAVYLACGLGLVLTGHVGLGIALVAVSGIVNGLAQLPEIRRLVEEPGPVDGGR